MRLLATPSPRSAAQALKPRAGVPALIGIALLAVAGMVLGSTIEVGADHDPPPPDGLTASAAPVHLGDAAPQAGSGGTLRDIWRVHRPGIIGFVGGLAVISALLAIVRRRNRAIVAARAEAASAERRWALALDGAGHGVWDWNIKTGKVFFSRQWKRILGYDDADVGSTREEWRSRVHPEDLPGALADLERHLRDETPSYRNIHRMRGKDGRWRWILDRGMVYARGADGSPERVVGTHADVTREREAQQALSHHQDLFAVMIAQSSEGVVVVDTENLRFLVFNAAACKSLGYTEAEMAALRVPDIQAEMSEQQVRERMTRLVAAGGGTFETVHRRKDGSLRNVRLNNQIIMRDQQAMMASTWTDITEHLAQERALRESRASLAHMAYYEPMTGLPNRRLLLDRLEQAIAMSDGVGAQLAVCSLDLDDFKSINDTHGRRIGDALIKALARRLGVRMHASDTLARWGGDEFAILLTELGSAKECEERLLGLLQATSEPIVLDGASFTLSASIGAALFPQDQADADTLLRHADHAMCLAKQRGRHNVQFFDPSTDALASAHRDQVRELALALKRDELCVYYQPILDMRGGTVQAFEALVRWNHPELGLLAPGSFLPAIEGTELISDLDRWVLEHALADLARWTAQNPALQVHVNVSAHSLASPAFLDEVTALLDAQPTVSAGQNLILEVLETSALKDIGSVSTALQGGIERGLRFALDDFGTGYSSLTYFRQLPTDVLKIDQSFIRNMLHDTDDLRIVEAVIGLARAFDRGVVAEGVETEDHGTMLLRMGCDLGQGYGIARPMPPEQVLPWIRSYKQPVSWQSIDNRAWLPEDIPLLTMEVEHRDWLQSVLQRAAGDPDVVPATLDVSQCRSERWYNTDGARRYGHLPGFRRLGQLHERVHALADGLIAERATRDPDDDAQLEALRDTSTKLIEQLHRLEEEAAARRSWPKASVAGTTSTGAEAG